MASAGIGSLRVDLGMNTAAFTDGIDLATRKMNKFSNQMKKTGAKMKSLGKNLTLGLTAPIVAMGAASVKSFSDFEKSMSNVSTLIDTNTESLKAMGDEVLAMSKELPVAIDDLTASLYDVRSAGISAGDAMEVLDRSARLGVAGLGSTSEAVDIVTSSINAFGLEGEDADKVYDNIFKTVKNGKTTISGLAQGFGAVAGTVANAGINLDEYLASVAALTTTGLPAAQAHTQIRAAIAGLTRETKESAAVFDSLGVKTFPELIGKSGGMVQAFAAIKEKLGGNDAAMLKLFGSTEALNAVLGLTGNQAAVFKSTLEDMRGGADAVGDAFDKQAGGTAAQAQVMRNQLEAVGVQIGQFIVPVVIRLADALSDLLTEFQDLDPDTQKWIVGLVGVLAAIGPVVYVVGSLVTAVKGMVALTLGVKAFALGLAGIGPAGGVAATGASAAGLAIRGLTASLLGLLLNPAVAAFAVAIGLIYLAWKNWDKIKPIIDRIAKAVTDFWNKHVSPVFNFIWDGLKLVVGAWLGMYTGVWNVLKKLGSAIKEWLGDKLGAIFDGVRKKLKFVADLFFQLYDAVVGNSYIPDMVDEIGQNMDRLEKLMVDPAEKATKKVKEAFRDMASDALSLMNQLFPLAAQLRDINSDLVSLDKFENAGLISAAQAADGRSVLLEERAKARGEVDISTAVQIGGVAPIFDQTKIKLIELEEVVLKIPPALNQAQEKMVEFAEYVGDSLMGGIFDVLTGRGSFKKVFSDLLGNVLNESIRTAMRSLETNLFGEKGLGGFLGSVLGGLFGGKRAAGGPVSAGKTFLVGEEGPELFSPSSGGKITPNSALTGGGGMTINVDARGSTDPNAVRAEVERGILEAAPHIVAAAQSRTVRTLQRPRLAGMAR